MSTEREIELINNIIKQAIEHGGDSGGAYGSNTNKLYYAVADWLNERGYRKEYTLAGEVINDGGYWRYVDDTYPAIKRIDELEKIGWEEINPVVKMEVL